jgi:hypothetical protein
LPNFEHFDMVSGGTTIVFCRFVRGDKTLDFLESIFLQLPKFFVIVNLANSEFFLLSVFSSFFSHLRTLSYNQVVWGSDKAYLATYIVKKG